MKALHFGAGNIGRGFIGEKLVESGFDLTFSDINEDLVESINFHHKYTIKIIQSDKFQEKIISGIKAINSKNLSVLIPLLSEVNLITTAVGSHVLECIAENIAESVICRVKNRVKNILYIIACENMTRGTSVLKKYVLRFLPVQYHSYLHQYVNFIDSVVDRIIPSMSNVNMESSLLVLVEEFYEWIVDSTQIKGVFPNIIGLKFSNNLISFIERKLFTLNTAHSVTAYLGLFFGYKTVYNAISDNKIRNIVLNAMKESGQVLIKRYNFNHVLHDQYIHTILNRFSNFYLSDNLKRIARFPLKKLNRNERLFKPILGNIEYNFLYKNLSIGVASVLHYCDDQDIESHHIQNLIKKIGLINALIKISGINMNYKLVLSIVEEYYNLIHYKFLNKN
ncbi:Mannitol-1-phosphate 5-dehydrogenase [Buchnera aphidicola (Eriosoma grossulariae)]|uniref:mannitol-1-phosphate 5-dehydrogenase n=1 Tax=Buchnera aphidicola TaxID=9 RepID=UPI0034645619